MKRFGSPKIKINQTHYPDQSLSRERLPPNGTREDSVDHQKYKPIMRHSSSRLQTPSEASRNNLFEAALKQTHQDHRSPQVDSTRSMLNPSSQAHQTVANKQSFKTQISKPTLEHRTNINPHNEPRAVRELVEKNALFEKRDQELSTKIKAGKSGIALASKQTTLDPQIQRPHSPRLQSPSSSNLYKPFFPGVRTPKSSQGNESHLRSSSNIRLEISDNKLLQSPHQDTNEKIGRSSYALDVRSYEFLSRNEDAISIPERIESNELEMLKSENLQLKERLQQMEIDQGMILQLNQLLLEKLSQLSHSLPTEIAF